MSVFSSTVALLPVPRLVHGVVVSASLMALPSAWADLLGDQTGPKETRFGLGLGFMANTKPYAKFGNDTGALPILAVENNWLSIAGPRADLKLYAVNGLSLRLRAAYGVSDGYKATDAVVLRGMAERKSSGWLGVAALWRTDVASFSAEWLRAPSQSKGQTLRLSVERDFPVTSAFSLTPRVGVVRYDKKYVDYYYGVRREEATFNRSAYAGSAVTQAELGLRMTYDIVPKAQSVFLDVSVTSLGKGIKNSPLVDRSSTSSVKLGYLYRF